MRKKQRHNVGKETFLFASIVDERNSYLTGLDIICDGGVIASGVSAMAS